MNDAELLERFETQRIAPAEWNHPAHVRIGWLRLARDPFPAALDRLRGGIRRLNAVLGVSESLESGYHETLTRAFLQLIDVTMRLYGPHADSIAFCDSQPQLLERRILRLFYSRGRIVSWEAKRRFVEPDLAPLPVLPGARQCGIADTGPAA